MASTERAAADAIAAIDIGTNSFHLARRPPDRQQPLRDPRPREGGRASRVGLGRHEANSTPDAIDRGVAALAAVPPHRRRRRRRGPRRRHQRRARGREPRRVPRPGARRRPASTSRSSPASRRPGSSTSACSRRCPSSTSSVLVIDIGGGSTEFVLGLGGEMLDARSLKLGAIRMTERFFAKEPVKRRPSTRPRRTSAASSRRCDADGAPSTAGSRSPSASSGTILNVAEMVQAAAGRRRRCASSVEPQLHRRRARRPRRRSRRPRPTAAERLEVARSRPEAGRHHPRRRPRARAGRSPPSASRRWSVSDYALREGVLLDVLRRRARHRPSGTSATCATRACSTSPSLTPGEKAHSERVAELALQLFEGTRDLHGLDDDVRGAARGGRPPLQRRARHQPRPPPPAQLLRDPQHRPADRLHRPRGRADRPGRPLPPQVDAEGPPPRVRPPRLDDDQQVVRDPGRPPAGRRRPRPHPRRDRPAGAGRSRRSTQVRCESSSRPATCDAELELYSAAARKDLLEDALGREVELVAA